MKVCVLLENTKCREDVINEHGLSLYIETANHKILFDTGQSDAFADNAKTMNIDLSKVDIAILSHGHYDHGGGIKKFLELNDHAPIYIQKDVFEPHYNGSEKYIGLDLSLQKEHRFIVVENELVIDDEITITTIPNQKLSYPINPYGLNKLHENHLVPDDFHHEQYVLLHDHMQTILLSGCSHKGILNIEKWFQPDVLIGGFHFKKLDPMIEKDQTILHDAALELMQYKTKYYTCHCTGVAQYEYLKQFMQDQLDYLPTGKTIHV